MAGKIPFWIWSWMKCNAYMLPTKYLSLVNKELIMLDCYVTFELTLSMAVVGQVWELWRLQWPKVSAGIWVWGGRTPIVYCATVTHHSYCWKVGVGNKEGPVAERSGVSALLHYNEGRRPHRHLHAFSASLIRAPDGFWKTCLSTKFCTKSIE